MKNYKGKFLQDYLEADRNATLLQDSFSDILYFGCSITLSPDKVEEIVDIMNTFRFSVQDLLMELDDILGEKNGK